MSAFWDGVLSALALVFLAYRTHRFFVKRTEQVDEKIQMLWDAIHRTDNTVGHLVVKVNRMDDQLQEKEE